MVGLVLLISLAACGGNEQNQPVSSADSNENTSPNQPETVIRLSHNMPADSGPDLSAQKFKELVEERTNGSLKVEIYGQSQLGSMREQTESVQLGSTEMTIQPISTLTPFVEDLQIVDYPFLWPNEEVLWKTLDSEAGDAILDTMKDAGFKGLGFWASGFKGITANKEIRTPDDFSGFKMRVIPSPLLIAQYEAWGANPVPVDFAELYNSLQQGVVDGQENPLETIYLQKYFEVQNQLIIANHGYLAYISTFNLDFFESLSAEHQEIIIEAEIEARELGRSIAADKEAEYVELLEESGMRVYFLTEEQREAFRELSAPVHKEFSKTDRQQKILQLVYDSIEAAQ